MINGPRGLHEFTASANGTVFCRYCGYIRQQPPVKIVWNGA
jgi:hypothetical protein